MLTLENEQTIYRSPIVKVLEIKHRTIVCQSGGIKCMNIDANCGDDF